MPRLARLHPALLCHLSHTLAPQGLPIGRSGAIKQLSIGRDEARRGSLIPEAPGRRGTGVPDRGTGKGRETKETKRKLKMGLLTREPGIHHSQLRKSIQADLEFLELPSGLLVVGLVPRLGNCLTSASQAGRR
jgi:hypothetical protein